MECTIQAWYQYYKAPLAQGTDGIASSWFQRYQWQQVGDIVVDGSVGSVGWLWSLATADYSGCRVQGASVQCTWACSTSTSIRCMLYTHSVHTTNHIPPPPHPHPVEYFTIPKRCYHQAAAASAAAQK